MDIEQEVLKVIGQPESETLEYKAVLPPAKSVAKMICAFANTSGGLIILGVSESIGKPKITGLSEDFHANTILQKAIELLTPTPIVNAKSIYSEGRKLYAIKVEKARFEISIEGKIYKRKDEHFIELNPSIKKLTVKDYSGLKILSDELLNFQKKCTAAMSKFIDHYLSVLNIAADLKRILYPTLPTVPTTNPEGKILMRILFSSCADNFETYLSDLLYEIYLAKPETLKSNQQVTVKEVLDCTDIQEFIAFYAKKKLGKLQRGNVKGFISENSQIKGLNAIDETQEKEVEKILQIRHLYTHKNGVVDEKFLEYFPAGYKLNDIHEMDIDGMLKHLKYLSDTVYRIDIAAIGQFNLGLGL